MDQPVEPEPAPPGSDPCLALPALEPDAIDVTLADEAGPPRSVELVPIAPPPIDPAQMDVTLATDPLPQLELLQRSRWRWKFVALVGLVAFTLITLVSVLQFWGTFVTCQLLAQARQDAERAREETSQSLDQHRKIFQELMTDRQEARQLRGQLAMLREEWDNIQTRLKDAREREDPLEVRRQELSDLLGKEADRLIELIRREGMDHAAFLEAVIHEGYHGDAVNPLVPNPPRPGVID